MPSTVGRDRELSRLESVCQEAVLGSGRLVLLTGEAGIGKSWLASRAVESARTKHLGVARGWCTDDAGAPPLWPWRRVGRDVPGLGAILDRFAQEDAGIEARLRLADSVSRQLCDAATRGLLLILDDLHWADELTLDLLRRVVPDLAARPVVVVATARTDGTKRVEFATALGALIRAPHTVHLPLSGLSEDAVAAWLAEDPATAVWLPRVSELMRLSGGNPFYLRSLTTELDALTDPDVERAMATHPGWVSMLTTNFRELDSSAREIVTVAAILGEQLVTSLIAVAVGRPVDEVADRLGDAVLSGLLHFGDTGLAFRHALVREAVIASLTPAETLSAHAAAARALETIPELAGAAALHWSHIPGPDAAQRCRALATAGAEQMTLAPERGLELARLALESAMQLRADAQEQAVLLLTCARFEWAAGRFHQAIATCQTGLEMSLAHDRADLAADFALIPQGVGSLDDATTAGRMCRRVLAVLPDSEAVRRARLLAVSAVAEAEGRQPMMAIEAPRPSGGDASDPDQLSVAALEIGRASGDAQAELETIAARHFVLTDPITVQERAALAERAVVLAPKATTTMGALWGHLWRADVAFQYGQTADVRTAINAVEAVARQRNSPIASWHELRLRAALSIFEGRLDDARSSAAQARQIADRVGDVSMIGMHYAFAVNLALLRGDASDVLPDTIEVLYQAPPLPLVRIGLVLIHALQGDFDGARSGVEAFRTIPEQHPPGPRRLGTLTQIGMAATLVADDDLARRCYRVLLPSAPWCAGDGGGSPFAAGSNELLLGDLARTAGDLDTALSHYERALRTNQRVDTPPYTSLARLHLAEALLAAGADPTRALSLARTAAAEFERLDMPGPRARAATVVRQVDTSPAGSVATTALSGREREVASLVADALTNQQIADRLFVSVRTVESHVRSILNKCGFTSRTQIAVWVRDGAGHPHRSVK